MSILKALACLVTPGAAAVISLVTDFIPKMRESRLEAFVVSLAEDLGRLSEAQHDTVQTEEFADLLTKTLPSVASEHRAEKIAAYRNLLVNSLAIDATEDEAEMFLLRLDRMTALHLVAFDLVVGASQMLGGAAQDPVPGSRPSGVRVGDVPETAASFLAHPRLQGSDRSSLASALIDLVGMGLLHESVRERDYYRILEGDRPRRDARLILTPYGLRFFRFVSPPPGEDSVE